MQTSVKNLTHLNVKLVSYFDKESYNNSWNEAFTQRACDELIKSVNYKYVNQWYLLLGNLSHHTAGYVKLEPFDN